jgi:hypothetical protein
MNSDDLGSMRETWAVRAMFLGFGAFFVLGSYLVLMPDMAPNQRSWVARAYPFVALAGLVAGLLVMAIDRRKPSLFARVTPATLALPSMGLLGVLMFVSSATLILVGAAAAGMSLLAAIPWVRFPLPVKRTGSESDETESREAGSGESRSR